ncbi:hypothetical protein [Brachybacterium sp. p3-SID957]|uniref:hypothetical protein n=1 Tax=Brachybacterium sp. p3-SID957 TaxID=2916049 RepID=UPI00223A6954|nr:hypothetical protein [Brachybacterium sp. p3-SID957]MCT1774809.1 hypothetical protein [Brachybacterium sp. p3-SID957]
MTQHDPAPHDATEQDPAPHDATEQGPARTTVYVRGRRTPTLAFWVVLALVVPAVVALIAAPLLGVGGAGGILAFAFIAVLSIGVPLAALAALVDLILERRRRR